MLSNDPPEARISTVETGKNTGAILRKWSSLMLVLPATRAVLLVDW